VIGESVNFKIKPVRSWSVKPNNEVAFWNVGTVFKGAGTD